MEGEATKFASPEFIAVSRQGHLFVTDPGRNCVCFPMKPAGNALTVNYVVTRIREFSLTSGHTACKHFYSFEKFIVFVVVTNLLPDLRGNGCVFNLRNYYFIKQPRS